jgi:hypothetical protein
MVTFYAFLSGAIAMGFVAAGLFFLRFWSRTRDRLFLAFAFSFWLLGLSQTVMTLTDIPVEERSWLYLLRLAAFLLILYALWLQNRRRGTGA